MKQPTAQLNKYEIKFYVLTCILCSLNCMYQVFLAGDYLNEYGNNFIDGWKWLGRKRDNYDHQWRIWIQFIENLIPWIFLQVLISRLLKRMEIHSTIICSWYIIITGTFLWNYYGIGGVLYLLIPTCIVCVLSSFQSKSLVYVTYMAILIASRFSTISNLIYHTVNVDPTMYYLLTSAFFWLQLKGINCCVDNINDCKHKNVFGFLQNIIQCMAYCWYLPTLFSGPHILFQKFIRNLDRPVEKGSSLRIILQLLNLLRFTFWLFVNEFMCHYLYITALMYHPHEVEKLGAWAFYGLGYCLGQHFCNKYIVLYGIAGEISRMEDIDAPPPPKCISRIHLYSDMWKYFDRGLYEFLVRYIYVPICSLNIPLQKFVASMITFLFVYMWHGIHKFVLIWTILNFVGVVLESIVNSIGNSRIYIKRRDKFLSPQNARRLNCMLMTPVLAMSAIANLYFCGGELIGYLYVYRLFHDPPVTVFIVMFVLYCGCQVSTELKLNEYCKAINNRRRESIGKKSQ